MHRTTKQVAFGHARVHAYGGNSTTGQIYHRPEADGEAGYVLTVSCATTHPSTTPT